MPKTENHKDKAAAILTQSIILKVDDEWFFFCYSDESVIKNAFVGMKNILPETIGRLFSKKSQMYGEKDACGRRYLRFRVSKEQFIVLRDLSELKNFPLTSNLSELLNQVHSNYVSKNIVELTTIILKYPPIINFSIKNNQSLIDLISLETDMIFMKRFWESVSAVNDSGITKLKSTIEKLLNSQIHESKIDYLKTRHPYVQYTATLRQPPSAQLKKQYIDELKQIYQSDEKAHVTPSEHQHIMARKLWTDVVSLTDKDNHASSLKKNIKKQVIKRLRGLDIANPENVYEKCLIYLRDYTVLTLSFRLSKLPKNLTSHELLNYWQLESQPNSLGYNHDSGYARNREESERNHFDFLPQDIKNALLNNNLAKPRYGSLHLLDRNKVIYPTALYGDSFIVLKDIVKQNCLFVPGDSMNFDKIFELCTFNHLEILLAQLPAKTFQAVVKYVTEGRFPNSFSQDRSHPSMGGGYIEVMLPSVNWLDKNLVEHIHLDLEDTREFASKNDLENLKNIGIPISYDRKNPYVNFVKVFFKHIDSANYQAILGMLKRHPSLIKHTDEKGRVPIERLWVSCKNKLPLLTFIKQLPGSLKDVVQSQMIYCQLPLLKYMLINNLSSDDLFSAFVKNDSGSINKILNQDRTIKDDELVIAAANNGQWECVLTYLKLRQLPQEKIFCIFKMANELNLSLSISQRLCLYLTHKNMLTFAIHRIEEGCLPSKNNFKDLLITFISASNNMQANVDMLHEIYNAEKKSPYLIKPSKLVSWSGSRWQGNYVSSKWIKVIEVAKRRIIDLAKTNPETVCVNDNDIIAFLKTPTTRWTDFFTVPAELAEYLAIKNSFLRSQFSHK